MVIITHRTKRTKLSIGLALAVSGCVFGSSTYAQQTNAGLNVSGRTSAEVIVQNVESNSVDSTLNTFVVVPEISLSYISRKTAASLVGSLTHLERDSDSSSQKQDYGEYSFNGGIEVIDNVLNINGTRAVSFQNALQNNFLVNDFVNDQDGLVKSTSNAISANFTIPNGSLIQGNASTTLGNFKTDRSEFIDNGSIDSDIFTGAFSFGQGSDVSSVIWSLNGNYTESDRNRDDSQSEFTTQNANATFDFPVAKHLAIRVNGQNERTRATNLLTEFSAARSFSSYGAGLTYFQSNNRFISVSYNTTDSDVESQDGQEFVGAEISWAFSARTSIDASITRRFFGDSVNASIRYNTKKFRTLFTYTETVTTNSVLLSAPDSAGLFVCPIGSSDFSSCFQPDSLDFVPDAGQEFAQIDVQNIELDDGVILRQAGDFQIGYSFSRLNLGLFTNYIESTFLESNEFRKTTTAGLTLSYNLGVYTNLNARFSYAEIENSQTDIEDDVTTFEQSESDNTVVTVDLSHQLTQHMNLTAEYSYRDSTGNATNSIFGGSFTENRFSLGIAYSFN
ncbi:TIGR03016 family PEP-CTERM system-associated outer membrane protein [Alteromonas sp. 5E99-2]|uniref:TIGR03016 family PEP-CTERM system-associated outer membrane protein n=1 Tax=Alteromonas sp. 5E99-2 TaxID=2817683 RepID=UPI001A9847BF|nr:TIGR03016 family PEP-CTERM system-associated outer membrane protein [Alteromonas sp. 5E99-2]MBO1256553.1 TIGR03016 family PEP-CTERM system-associated outer membrane protein [Alteromonas sp. 5E99-2]